MSIETRISTIDVEDYLQLEELFDNLHEKLDFYKKQHPDFSVDIVKDIDNNKVIVKTIHLGEHAN